jgi:alanine dehydrogenase
MKRVADLDAFLITNKEVREVIENIGWKVFISEIKKGFKQSTSKQAVIPNKIYINTEVSDMRCMPAYLPGYNSHYCGVKIISVAPENKKLGLLTVIGEYLLRDAKTQKLIAIIQAEEMTAYRTGAASGVATELLSDKNCKTLGIIGTGKQAYYQIKATLAVRAYITKIKLYDIVKQYAKNFKKRYEKEFDVDMIITDLEDAVDSDIVITITPSTKAFISSKWVKAGTHINGVGADSKIKIEFEPDILKKSKVFVDMLSQCIHSGEIYQGLKKKIIREKDLISIGDILIGKAEGKTNKNDITFFKSTGVAFEDLITAILVFEKLKG